MRSNHFGTVLAVAACLSFASSAVAGVPTKTCRQSSGQLGRAYFAPTTAVAPFDRTSPRGFAGWSTVLPLATLWARLWKNYRRRISVTVTGAWTA